VAELRRGATVVETLFDLVGARENDLTASLGWALSRSDRLLAALLGDVLGVGPGDAPLIRLQRYDGPGGGFTDIEIDIATHLLVVEAKVGWDLPGLPQLTKYARRIPEARGAILVISEASQAFATAQGLPDDVDGRPVIFRRWSDVVALARSISGARGAEKQMLYELVTYLGGAMTVQDVTSNMVRVVAVNDTPIDWMSVTFAEFSLETGRLFHPVVGRGFPREPPNYFGFRYHGKLDQIRHVDSYEVVMPLDDYVPEIRERRDWMDSPYYLYRLGPPIRPNHDVRSTRQLFRGQHVEAALDLLLTHDTIPEAVEATRARLNRA
jgi:hypothetical protein